MIILRSKNYSLFSGLFGSKKPEPKVVQPYIPRYPMDYKNTSLDNLMRGNTKQYLIKALYLDDVTSKLKELDRSKSIKVPQEIYKYIETVKSFSGPFKSWLDNHKELDVNQVTWNCLRIEKLLGSFEPKFTQKLGNLNLGDIVDEDGDVIFLDIKDDNHIVYNLEGKVWNIYSTDGGKSGTTLKNILLESAQNDIKCGPDDFRDGVKAEIYKELIELWINHIKSRL